MWNLIDDDKWPPPDVTVLTLWDGVNNKSGEPARYYEVAHYDGGDWYTNDGGIIDPPTHWTWLPPPPQ